MKTKIEKIVETTGTGTGENLNAQDKETRAAYRREVNERFAQERSDRIEREGKAIADGRTSEIDKTTARREALPPASVERIKAAREVSKIQRASVRNAIAAHAACLVPAAASKLSGLGGWEGANRVEQAVWRSAVRYADKLAMSSVQCRMGSDGRSGLREIVFSYVGEIIEAAQRSGNVGQFRTRLVTIRAEIKAESKKYLSGLRDERRRQQEREEEQDELNGMDAWNDRDEWSGSACSPWTADQAFAAHERGIELPRLVSSDPRALHRGEPGKRREILTAAGDAIFEVTMQAARMFAQNTGKGAGPRIVGARALAKTAECVRLALVGEALPPEEAAGLSSGKQGGIGAAWRTRMGVFKAAAGI